MWKSNRCRSSNSTPERHPDPAQYFTMGRHAAVPNATTTQQSSSTTANRSDNATKPEHHPLSTRQNVPMYIPACAQPFGKLVILAQALSLKSCWGEPTHTHTLPDSAEEKRKGEVRRKECCMDTTGGLSFSNQGGLSFCHLGTTGGCHAGARG